MAQDKILKCLGLVAQYNPLSTQPGALSRANDCMVRRENIVEDRRGHKLYGSQATQTAQLMGYLSTVLSHRGSAVSYDNGSGTFTDYSGSYSAITGQKMRFVEQFSNLYATTSGGIKVFTDVAGTAAKLAGAPRSLDPSYVLNATATGFLSGGYQCAYRTCITRTDANSNVVRSYPSTRLWAINPTYSPTANAAAGSTTLTALSSNVGIVVGQTLSGLGIPAGTTVVSVSSATLVMSAAAVLAVTPTGNITAASTTVDGLSSVAGIAVAMSVTGAGIPAGTTVASITGTSLVLTNKATSTTVGAAVGVFVSGTGITLTLGSPRNIDLTLYIPSECASGDVIEFYRTAQVASTSSDISGDEMSLVYQVALGTADISNGYINFTDSITDALRGAALYTSPSQEGIAQANDRPPLAKDICSYKNFMFYANTQTKQRLFLTLVGTSSLTTNTVIIASVTYKFGSTEITAATPTAAVGTTGVAAVDIDTTARSLVRVINRYSGNTSIYAYYLTGPGDLPGQIMLEEKGIGAAAFTVQVSSSTIAGNFFPAPPVTPSTTTKSTSSNQAQKNAVYYSKSQQGEHVPSLNYLLVGAANKSILRIAPLRDSTIVIKEEGVYRIAGQDPTSFTVVPIDLTVFCKAVDSVAVLGNQVYMLSNQGIVSISDTSVQVISRDIEQLIQPLLTYSSIGTYTTGVAYESERSYYISTMSSSVDTAQTQTFVYNYFTKAWVRHSYAMVAGVIGADDKMYFAKPANLNVYQERKSFTDDDYADPEYAITIVSITGAAVRFTLSGTVPKVGWVISQSAVTISIGSYITNSAGDFTATMTATPPSSWLVGAASLYPSVGMDIIWQSWTANEPANLKQVRQTGILADDESTYNSVSSFAMNFTSNFDSNVDSVTMSSAGQGWGTSAWDSSPWGGSGDSAGYVTYVPRNKQYCTRLQLGVTHPVALERLSIAGCAFAFEMGSERIGR